MPGIQIHIGWARACGKLGKIKDGGEKRAVLVTGVLHPASQA
jgi:hypothetical protein